MGDFPSGEKGGGVKNERGIRPHFGVYSCAGGLGDMVLPREGCTLRGRAELLRALCALPS